MVNNYIYALSSSASFSLVLSASGLGAVVEFVSRLRKDAAIRTARFCSTDIINYYCINFSYTNTRTFISDKKHIYVHSNILINYCQITSIYLGTGVFVVFCCVCYVHVRTFRGGLPCAEQRTSQ